MKVIEILELIDNEINNCNQRLEFLHKMRIYLTGSLIAFEEDEEEKAYIAAEREGKQLDNGLVFVSGRVER